jgi:hypothetical protein
MASDGLSMLAVGMEDLVGVAILAVVMIGSAVASAVNKHREKKQAEERIRVRQEKVRQPVRLDDEGLPRRQPGGSTEPTNLTMAERIERVRAKAAYEERARQLREAQGGAQPVAQMARREEAEEAVARRREAEPMARQRSEAERVARQREEQAAQAELARRRAAEQVRQQAQLQAQRAQQRASQQLPQAGAAQRAPQRRAPIAPAPAMREAPRPSRAMEAAQQATVMRAVAARQAGAKGAAAVVAGQLRGRNLRDAIVLKEILDRPLALRDPSEGTLF